MTAAGDPTRANRFAGHLALALLAVAGTTTAGRLLRANAPTIGFVYLVAVVGVALGAELPVAFVASLAAAACYNFFFLPPVGTFTIADPANWVALATFLFASTLVTRLVARADRRARQAEGREREIGALYDLSVDLFTSTNRLAGLGEAAGRALRTIGARSGGMTVLGEESGRVRPVRVLGDPEPRENALIVDSVLSRGEMVELPAAGGERDVYIPLAPGGRTLGVLAVHGTRAGGAALRSVGRLLGLAMERERFLDDRSHMEALRASDALKTSLLRAVSHDLRSPMTAIRLRVDRLRRGPTGSGEDVKEMSREVERLSHRIDNLLAMARLDTGSVTPNPEPVPAADLFRAALDQLPLVLEGHPVELSLAPEAPEVFVDPALVVEILVNLLENAARVSPESAPIELAAAPDPFAPDRVQVDVRDRGPGMPEAQRSGTGDAGNGLGLEICRGLAKALQGSISFVDRPGGGTIARLDLPAARLEP